MDIHKPNALRLAIRYIQDLCRSHTRFLHRAHPSYPVCVRENFESCVSMSTDTVTKRVDTTYPLNSRSMEITMYQSVTGRAHAIVCAGRVHSYYQMQFRVPV
jgi:hypothetical protein